MDIAITSASGAPWLVMENGVNGSVRDPSEHGPTMRLWAYSLDSMRSRSCFGSTARTEQVSNACSATVPGRPARSNGSGLASSESRLVYRLPTKGGAPKPTPDGRTQLLSPGPKSSNDPEPAPPSNPARIRWATLLARIYEVLPLLCPACVGQMNIAFLSDRLGRRIHLARRSRAP
jgi:hypothetical protein